MIALVAILIGLVIGMIRGGRLSRLADLHLERPLLLLAGFVVLAFLQLGPAPVRRGATHWLLLGGSYVLVLAFLWMNRRSGPMRLVASGVLLNLPPIIANGGMPVSLRATRIAGLPDPLKNPELLGEKHVIATADSPFRFLGDVIPIPLPFVRQAISVGDVLVLAGIAWLVAKTLQTYRVGR